MWQTIYVSALPKNLGVGELIFGCAVKVVSSPGVRCPCLSPNKKTLQTQNFANLQAIYQEIRNYEGCERKEQHIFARFELISKAWSIQILFHTTGDPCLMRISLLRISLLLFFKTFLI